MAFAAFLDTDVLFPVSLRDSMLWIAHVGVYSPRWIADVLCELRTNLLEKYASMAEVDLDVMIADMRAAFPEAEVAGYEQLVPVMTNNEKDRHVLAAAVVGGASVIVTNDGKGFPESSCAPYRIDVQSADTFLLHALTLAPYAVHEAIGRQAAIKRSPSMSVADVLRYLERNAPNFVREARIAWEILPSAS